VLSPKEKGSNVMTDTLLCSELISIEWTSTKAGGFRHEEGVLEEITAGIAVIWTNGAVPLKNRLSIRYRGESFNGAVLGSVTDGDGYLTRLVLYGKSETIRPRHAVSLHAA
jgi:hypothetical protein